MEQLDYNLLYRWFVGLSPDDPVWVPTTFTKNRDRLREGDVFEKFMTKLLNHPQVKPLLSNEHFSVDGTLIEAWASHKSFRPKDGSDDGDGTNFHRQKRTNETHASATDPDSRLYRKAEGARRNSAYMGHVAMENRKGLAVVGMVTTPMAPPNGAPQRPCSSGRQGAGRPSRVAKTRPTIRRSCCGSARRSVTPHVTQNNGETKTGKRRKSAIDGRTTRHAGYGMSQTRRAMTNAFSAGANSTGRCARPSIAASIASPPTSCSISSPTIWSACRSSSRHDTPRVCPKRSTSPLHGPIRGANEGENRRNVGFFRGLLTVRWVARS